jgi:hypothetical protein
MPCHIQPDKMAAAYELVRVMEPFNQWAKEEGGVDFPHSDEVEFRIVGDSRSWAWKQRKPDGSYILAYSDKAPTQVHYFVMYMAHEMIHLYQDMNGLENTWMHNSDFRARAEEVCAIHGYDLKMFF